MPLHDHFHSPVGNTWPWVSIHGVWATCITQYLNQEPLPPRYLAIPHMHLGNQAQVDVATLHEEGEVLVQDSGNGAVATAVWAPPKPALSVAIDFADVDVFEIQVFSEQGEHRLVAAIELVSPANKDRPSHRRAFAAKCLAYLQQGISVVVVDVVTERRENLHAELMQLVKLNEAAAVVPFDLYAIAYRPLVSGEQQRLELWPAELAVGKPLPTLPLWIAPDLAVPLDLEASYLAACESIRLRL